jgi:hypothetical protein
MVQEAGWVPEPVWTCVENFALTGIWSPDLPAHSESIHRLSYPGLQGRTGRVRKISPLQEFDPRTVQPVASRCTDWAVAFHLISPITVVHQKGKATAMKIQSGYSSSSLGVTTSYIESFSLLNDISPFTTVLDADSPIPYLHFTDVLFNNIIPSALRSSL